MMPELDTYAFTSSLKGTAPTFRRRLGTVVSVETGYTMTVQLAGDTTSISGVRYFGHYPPKPGAHVWVDTDGADLICIGAIAGNGGAAPAAKVYKSANQSFATGTQALVTFSTATFDPYGMFNDANDSFVIPFDGIWLVTTNIFFDTNATGARGIYINKNGNVQITTRVQAVATSGSATMVSASTHVSAVKSEEITVNAIQYSGGALNVIPSGDSCCFTISYVGPAA